MPDTRITKERLKNHWLYSSWKYLLMIVIFVVGWNLTYSITEYKPPREKRLEMYFLSTTYVQENIEALQQELTPLFVGEDEGDMEELNFLVMNYGGEDDTYGPQVLMTRLAALEGDVYLVDESTLTSFVAQELAMPLDDYIASGALNVEGQNLETVTRNEPAGEDDEGNPVYSNTRHVYALQAEPLYGLIEDNIIDNRGMYMVVMSYTDKPDKCIELLNAFTERFTIDKPEWVIKQEEKKKQEIASLPGALTVNTAKQQQEAIAQATAEAIAAATAEAESTASATLTPTEEATAAPEVSATEKPAAN